MLRVSTTPKSKIIITNNRVHSPRIVKEDKFFISILSSYIENTNLERVICFTINEIDCFLFNHTVTTKDSLLIKYDLINDTLSLFNHSLLSEELKEVIIHEFSRIFKVIKVNKVISLKHYNKILDNPSNYYTKYLKAAIELI